MVQLPLALWLEILARSAAVQPSLSSASACLRVFGSVVGDERNAQPVPLPDRLLSRVGNVLDARVAVPGRPRGHRLPAPRQVASGATGSVESWRGGWCICGRSAGWSVVCDGQLEQ
eukprot:6200819-Pleurochrysis_carterae.AAC.1